MNAHDSQEITTFGTPLTIHALIEQSQNRLRQGWTVGEAARNSRGRRVDYHHKTAVCWCLIGSLNRAYFDLTGLLPSYTGLYRILWLRLEHALWRRRGDKDLLDANDNAKSVALPLSLLDDARNPDPTELNYPIAV